MTITNITMPGPSPPIEEVPITIVGAGPVGMLLAYQLDRLNVPCLLAEQSLHTTKWPKMDLTNCRVMEMLRVLGLADEYRALEGSVGPDDDFDSLFVTKATGDGKVLGAWKRPTVNEQRKIIKQTNDGTQPAEPGHRCMQIIMEAWLKDLILSKSKSHVRGRFGWKYLFHVEDQDGVIATFVDVHGQQHTVRSQHLVACDGGSSRVRKTAGIKMVGGQMPARFYLVHFRSQELAEKLTFGRAWHTFPTHSGFIIDQDAKDIFTAHYPMDKLPGGPIDPREVVYRTLGGPGEKYEIKIDEISAHSEWRPNFSIAEQYHTASLKVFLAGDAAHRMPPHGGYGMNSGAIDALDLGWRLAAVTQGYGGPLLLQAYNLERRPMMIRALERSLRHLLEHVKLAEIYANNAPLLEANTPAGEDIRLQIRQFIDASGPDTMDHGIELDLRYGDSGSGASSSPVIYHDGSAGHKWDVKRYIPSTRPGCRAPHVFLHDGVTSTYDLFGAGWTLVHFVSGSNPTATTNDSNEKASEIFTTVARDMAFPLNRVFLRDEDHAFRVWEERDLVLVRPDTHVAWRGYVPASASTLTRADVEGILSVVAGRVAFPGYAVSCSTGSGDVGSKMFEELVAGFTDMHQGSSSSSSTILGEDV